MGALRDPAAEDLALRDGEAGAHQWHDGDILMSAGEGEDETLIGLAGYNAGENTVIRYGYKVPPYRETKQYVSNITSAYGKTWHEMPASQSNLNKQIASSTLPLQPDKPAQSQNSTNKAITTQ